MEGKNFMVGIRCLTYNHRNYIIDAMNGFTMQQTNFPFVAVIVDDASTDGEPEVINNYLEEYFDLSPESEARQWENEEACYVYARHKENKNCYFAVVLLKTNYYSKKKSKDNLFDQWLSDVKYIALCEGDDYWTHPQKLQSQVDFMENHNGFMICFHKVGVLMQPTGEMLNGFFFEKDVSGETTILDLVEGNYIPTASGLYRKDSRVDILIKSINSPVIGDYVLWMSCALYGNIYQLDEKMSVYRFGGGSWQSRSKTDQYVHILSMLNRLRMLLNVSRVVTRLDERIQETEQLIINLYNQKERELYNTKGSKAYKIASIISKYYTRFLFILKK